MAWITPPALPVAGCSRRPRNSRPGASVVSEDDYIAFLDQDVPARYGSWQSIYTPRPAGIALALDAASREARWPTSGRSVTERCQRRVLRRRN
ncbi:hypothetical protein [Micromonospora sp. NPDC005205]|uniref:hypothetical protein n=1 Tax=Micromonospora sp. NPDC005205 TaxID=3156714 RepID=UPI0033BC7B84